MRKGISRLLVIMILLVSCSGRMQTLSPERYVKFLEDEDNGYCSKQVIGSREYTIQLAPAEYVVSKEMESSDAGVTQASHRLAELEGHVFFLIKMGITADKKAQEGGKLQAEMQLDADRMVAYYDQQAILDISLSNGATSVKPVTYVFENNYGLSPYNTIVVGFDTGPVTGDLTLDFNDRYANIPAIRASFSKDKIQHLPKLVFK